MCYEIIVWQSMMKLDTVHPCEVMATENWNFLDLLRKKLFGRIFLCRASTVLVPAVEITELKRLEVTYLQEGTSLSINTTGMKKKS